MVDARDDETTVRILEDKGLRPIRKAQGKVLAAKLGAVKYLECSAKCSRSLALKPFLMKPLKLRYSHVSHRGSIGVAYCRIENLRFRRCVYSRRYVWT